MQVQRWVHFPSENETNACVERMSDPLADFFAKKGKKKPASTAAAKPAAAAAVAEKKSTDGWEESVAAAPAARAPSQKSVVDMRALKYGLTFVAWRQLL